MAQEIRLPPKDLDAEKALLGTLLTTPDAIYDCAGDLHHYNFYDGRHDVIYRSMMSLSDNGIPIDIVTLTNQMRTNGSLGRLEKTDDNFSFYLTALPDFAGFSHNVSQYKKIIIEMANARATIATCREIEEALYLGSITYAESQEKLIGLADRADITGYEHFGSALDEAYDKLLQIKKDGKLPGMASHYPDYDSMTGGFHLQDLVIIAGRPSMGKTSLALDFMKHVAKDGHPVALASIESSQLELAVRQLLQVRPDDETDYQAGIISEATIKAADEERKRLKLLPIYLDDSGGQSLRQVASRTRRLKAKYDIKFLFVDYLQLITGTKAENRTNEIAAYTRGLKALARNLNITVVALSQLSRDCEKRVNKRPIMSDLRDGGSIEQDADVILFLYRPEVYKIMVEPNGQFKGRDNAGIAELIIAKQRNGPTGTVEMTFLKERTSFRSIEQNSYEPTNTQTNLNDDNPF